MIRDDIYRTVLAAIAAARDTLPSTRWYGFGSFFRSQASFNDVDILAICSDALEEGLVRQSLDALAFDLPIDLIVMSENEAAETDFVARQECRQLL